MAYHNPQLNGPMKTKFIITEFVNIKPTEHDLLTHEMSINKFNIENDVWFNQVTTIKENYIYSVVLYTPKVQQ